MFDYRENAYQLGDPQQSSIELVSIKSLNLKGLSL